MRLSIACLSLLAFAAPALAADPAPAKADAGDPNKVICKRHVPIGQLAGGKKECRTRAEWEAIRRDAQDDTQRLQRATPNGGGPG